MRGNSNISGGENKSVAKIEGRNFFIKQAFLILKIGWVAGLEPGIFMRIKTT